MGRSSRLFEIIQILRHAPAPVSASVIADALEVSKRTVYRDIVTLQAMRVPIEGEAGAGYVMQMGFDLPPLMFTAEEIEAIVVGLSLIGRTGDADLLTAASRVSQKISEVLPNSVDSRLDKSPCMSRTRTRFPRRSGVSRYRANGLPDCPDLLRGQRASRCVVRVAGGFAAFPC